MAHFAYLLVPLSYRILIHNNITSTRNTYFVEQAGENISGNIGNIFDK